MKRKRRGEAGCSLRHQRASAIERSFLSREGWRPSAMGRKKGNRRFRFGSARLHMQGLSVLIGRASACHLARRRCAAMAITFDAQALGSVKRPCFHRLSDSRFQIRFSAGSALSDPCSAPVAGRKTGALWPRPLGSTKIMQTGSPHRRVAVTARRAKRGAAAA
jgi:hypothetical protein